MLDWFISSYRSEIGTFVLEIFNVVTIPYFALAFPSTQTGEELDTLLPHSSNRLPSRQGPARPSGSASSSKDRVCSNLLRSLDIAGQSVRSGVLTESVEEQRDLHKLLPPRFPFELTDTERELTEVLTSSLTAVLGVLHTAPQQQSAFPQRVPANPCSRSNVDTGGTQEGIKGTWSRPPWG